MIQFEVPGQPRGKARPRFARRGDLVMTYTTKKTMDYEALVRLISGRAMGGRVPVEHPCIVTIEAFFSIPSSWSKKKRDAAIAGRIYPGLIDLDNIAKAIFDGMNSIVYTDDRQVVTATLSKRFSSDPRVCVSVSEASSCVID
jgi:Holliday junction resolvase RusA-like endonuclease